MPSLSAARAANAKFSPSYIPIAVFVGGTSGIGKATAQAFARHTRGNAHIILVGRNRAAAEAVISSFPKSESEEAKHEFVECDVSLMRNVRKTTKELKERLPRLNYLVMTQGMMTTQGRVETEEGIDRKMALHYYSRWRFTYECVSFFPRQAKSEKEWFSDN